MATEYDVNARIRLSGIEQAKKNARSFGQSLGDIQQRVRGTESAMGGLVKQAVAFGAAYVGFQAVTRSFSGLSRSAIKYTSDLEKTKIGLTSVLSAVNNVPWETGQNQANKAFETLKDMSVTSPAGPQEMFNIFQGIVGPLRNAGTEMERVYAMTNDTVLAASALGVDFEQAQRDISLMARGAAGMDVKLFSLLRSTGAIKEDTAAWNKNLTAEERVQKLEVALKKFSASGSAFGKSWAGLTSTFGGLVKEMQRAAFTPVMRAMQEALSKVNKYLTENKVAIEALLNSYGNKVATWMRSAVSMGAQAFNYLTKNWSLITGRFEQAMSVLKKYGPIMAKVAGGMAVTSMARGPASGAMGLAGAIAPYAMSAMGMGSAAASGGGAAVASGGAAVAGGAVMAPVLAVLAALAAIGLAVAASWEPIVAFLKDDLNAALSASAEMASAAWELIKPLLVGVGTIMLAVLVPAFRALLRRFTILMKFVTPFLKILGGIAKLFATVIVAGFQWLLGFFERMDRVLAPLMQPLDYVLEAFGKIATGFSEMISSLLTEVEQVNADAKAKALKEQEAGWNPYDKSGYMPAFGQAANQMVLQGNEKFLKEQQEKKKVPGGRGGSTINVQKMVIRQDFKNKDPDRVVAQMMSDITKQAENRVSSRYRGALTG